MKEYLSSPEVLDASELYTAETIIYKSGLAEAKDNNEPIFFGRDINGVPYVTDGNHRAYDAWENGGQLMGQQISRGKFDVTKDSDFRHISQLRVV